MTTTGQLADPETGAIDDLVDTTAYPIHKPDSSRYRALMADIESQLHGDGCVTIRNFLRPAALERVADDVTAAAEFAPIRRQRASVYSRPDLESDLPADDPRCRQLEWHAGHVTRDMIPAYSPGHRLYVSALFKRFIADAVGRERVFEYADPLAGLIATVLPPGGSYPWHYDTNEFVVTIMTRQPDGGGEFEYHPNLRSPGDENLEGLRSALDGGAANPPNTVTLQPGDLQLFLGRYSLHRVGTVSGNSPRHVLVLSYADRPGVIGPVDRTRSVYGRVTEAHLMAAANSERTRVSGSADPIGSAGSADPIGSAGRAPDGLIL